MFWQNLRTHFDINRNWSRKMPNNHFHWSRLCRDPNYFPCSVKETGHISQTVLNVLLKFLYALIFTKSSLSSIKYSSFAEVKTLKRGSFPYERNRLFLCAHYYRQDLMTEIDKSHLSVREPLPRMVQILFYGQFVKVVTILKKGNWLSSWNE